MKLSLAAILLLLSLVVAGPAWAQDEPTETTPEVEVPTGDDVGDDDTADDGQPETPEEEPPEDVSDEETAGQGGGAAPAPEPAPAPTQLPRTGSFAPAYLVAALTLLMLGLALRREPRQRRPLGRMIL